MRPIMNRYERAAIDRELVNAKQSLFRSEIAYILNQPHETVVTWMNQIASKREEIEEVNNAGIIPKIGQIRPMTEHMQPEPSFGRVCVISVPDIGPGRGEELKAILDQRIIWQRFEDYYGKTLTRNIINTANSEAFYSSSLVLMAIEDTDTSFVIVVREPTAAITANAELIAEHADKVMGSIYRVLHLLETKADSLDKTIHARLPVAPRLLEMATRNEAGNESREFLRGYGLEVEMVLNGVVGDHTIDKIFLGAFWKHHVKYAREHSNNPEDLPGIYGAELPEVNDAVIKLHDRAAANDNIGEALGN